MIERHGLAVSPRALTGETRFFICKRSPHGADFDHAPDVD